MFRRKDKDLTAKLSIANTIKPANENSLDQPKEKKLSLIHITGFLTIPGYCTAYNLIYQNKINRGKFVIGVCYDIVKVFGAQYFHNNL